MSTSTVLVLLLIAIAVFFAIRTLKKNNGGCSSCGKSGDACAGCPLNGLSGEKFGQDKSDKEND